MNATPTTAVPGMPDARAPMRRGAPRETMPPDRIDLLGVPIDRMDARGACDAIFGALDSGRGGWVITPNLDILRRFVRDESFRALCEGAELRLADGMPLVWASRLQRTPLPERVAGSDLIWMLAERAATSRRSLFLLGGSPGSAEGAARVLAERFRGLRIAGTACPPYGFENDAQAVAGLDRRLKDAAPDIVLVGLGSPKQERLISRVRADLPCSWFLGIGVTFSFVTGDIRRAPPWARRLGVEWVHRLAQEPRRLARRYLVDGLPFGARLLLVSGARGFRRTRTRGHT